MSTVETPQTAKSSTRAPRAPAQQPTRISCHAPEATSVAIAGSFNDWNTESTVLQREKEGRWSVMLELTPGRYEYKFMVDGSWCCEPGNDDAAPGEDRVPNDFGTMNRVLVVE